MGRFFLPYRRVGISFGQMIDACSRARPKAMELVNQMTDENDEIARAVLTDVAEIVLARTQKENEFGETANIPVFDPKSRIAAAKTFLEFTKQKPKTVTQVEMTPEDWLEKLDEEENTDE